MNVNEVVLPNVSGERCVADERGSDRAADRVTFCFTEGNSPHEVSSNRNITSAFKANLSFQKDCDANTISGAIDTKHSSDKLFLNGARPETDDASEDQEKLSTKDEKIQVSKLANPTPNTKGCKEENQSASSQSLKAAGTTDIEDTSVAQMKCPWYDVHLAMQRRLPCDWNQVDDMMSKYSQADLRSKLMDVQQQLTVYHDLLDKYEESKAREAKWEKRVKELQAENTKYKNAIKKLIIQRKKSKQELGERESEIVQLKIDLAHSKCLQDHQESDVRRMSAGRKLLEEENESLRNINSLLSLKCEENEKNKDLDGIALQRRQPDCFGLYLSDKLKMLQSSTRNLQLGASASSSFKHSHIDESKKCTSSTHPQKQEGGTLPVVSSTKNEGNDDIGHDASCDTEDIPYETSTPTIKGNRWMHDRTSWFTSLSKTNERKTLQSSTRNLQLGASASSSFKHSHIDESKKCASPTEANKQEGTLPVVSSTKNEGNDDIGHDASCDT